MPDSSFTPPLAPLALPEAAFIDPHGANREAVERLAQQVLNLVLEYASTAAARSPLPNRAAMLPVNHQDEWNARLHAFLRERRIFLSLPAFRGHRWLRAVLLNPYTDETTLDRLFDSIDAFAQQNSP